MWIVAIIAIFLLLRSQAAAPGSAAAASGVAASVLSLGPGGPPLAIAAPEIPIAGGIENINPTSVGTIDVDSSSGSEIFQPPAEGQTRILLPTNERTALLGSSGGSSGSSGASSGGSSSSGSGSSGSGSTGSGSAGSGSSGSSSGSSSSGAGSSSSDVAATDNSGTGVGDNSPGQFYD